MFDALKNYLIVAVLLAAAFGGGYYAAGGLARSGMTEETCEILERKIKAHVDDSWFPSRESNSITKLNEMNATFAKNCKRTKLGIKGDLEKPDDEKIKPLPEKTCAAIEQLLEEKVRNESYENSTNSDDHIVRARAYANLTVRACVENQGRYKTQALREIEIALALDGDRSNIAMIYKELGMMAEALAILERLRKEGYNVDQLQQELSE